MKNFQYILTYNDLSFSEILNVNPINWDKLSLTYARNENYNSVFRSFTLSLRFTRIPGAGGENIYQSYLLKGISASIDIQIKELNTQTGGYENLYTGILDFNPDRFQIEKDWIEIGIIDADKLQKFKSREEINFDINKTVSADEISVDPFLSSPKDIVFKPIDIFSNVSIVTISKIPNELLTDPGDKMEAYLFSGESLQLGTDTLANNIGDRLKTTEGFVQFLAPGLGPNGYFPTDTTPVMYSNDTNSDTLLTFRNCNAFDQLSRLAIDGVLGNNSIWVESSIVVSVFDKDDVEIFSQFIDVINTNLVNVPAGTTIVDINFNLSVLNIISLNVPAGGYVNFISKHEVLQSNNAASISTLIYSANIEFVEKSLSIGETVSKSYFPHEAFTRLIQLITSETDDQKLFYSEFFGRTDSEFQTYPVNGPGSLDAITTAWNLRQFPNRAFNLNIADLFQTFDSIYSLGLGYDRVYDRFFVEPISNFFRSDYLMYDLGEVDDLVIKAHKESFNSKIDSGFSEKGSYEDFQGVNEYNLSSEHSTVLPVKQTKAGRAKYNGDSIGIELTRREQYKSNSSKDTKQDDKIYIVGTDGVYTIQNGVDVEGFEGINQYYNIHITPRENVIRHAGLIKSSLWLHDLRVKFVKAQKDINIAYTNQNGDSVNEFDDVISSDLVEPQIYIPQLYEFSSIINSEIIQILNSDPHGYFQFSFDGVKYQGFLMSVETGYYDKKANYSLLAKELTSGDNFIFENDDNFVLEDGNNLVFE